MSGVRSATRALGRLARGLAGAVRELDYWQRRAAVLWMAPDRFLAEPNRPPDTYHEFIARTAGALIREPSMHARLTGRQVG